MDKISNLKNFDIFDDLATDKLDFLEKASRMIKVGKNEIVFDPETCVGKVYLLKEGRVKIYFLSEQGKEVTVDMLEPGSIFGDLGNPEEPSVSYQGGFAQAELASLLCIVPKDTFFKLVLQEPKISARLISQLAGKLAEAEEKIADLAILDAKARLLSELIRIGKKLADASGDKVVFKRKFTHEELAHLIGTTRETVTKTFKELNHKACRGCVTFDQNGRIILHKRKIAELFGI